MSEPVFQSAADLCGYLFRIQDNGGASADRYDVLFSDGDALGLSAYPSHPQGVSLWSEGADPQYMQDAHEEGRVVDLRFCDLPENVQAHILARLNQAFADFAAAIDRREPHAVAKSREHAKPNEGTHRCGGVGIYAAGDAFCVRLDSDDAGDDRGPYRTAREALLATLPDQHGLSGPEYHSTESPLDASPRPDIAAAVAALEARVTAEWEKERESGHA